MLGGHIPVVVLPSDWYFILFCSHGPYECAERCLSGNMQRREERKETGPVETVLQGHSQIPDGDDETW